MLGLDFPCGKQLEELANYADKSYKCKIVLKDGNCCLSGVENQCAKMIDSGETRENVAKFCLDSIADALLGMTEYAYQTCGRLSTVYAGGVMSDKLLQKAISEKTAAAFSAAEFSCDNAAGTALYAAAERGCVKWHLH